METVVVGVGNRLREDDGIGLVVVQKLSKTVWKRNVDLLVLGDQLFALPEIALGYRRMVIIDALPPAGNPGRVAVFSEEDLGYGNIMRFSLHDLDLVWQIHAAQAKTACVIRVLGIEAGAIGWRLGLSPLLQRGLTGLLAAVEKTLVSLI